MPEETWFNDYVFVVDDFLTADQCRKYILLAESIGFEEATVTTPQGAMVVPSHRNNDRVIYECETIAAELWRQAQNFVPLEHDGWYACGVNELLRFYRYDPGQHFNWHVDIPFDRNDRERSCLTFMVYLNEVSEGGETSFEDSYSDESFDDLDIRPETGKAVFFFHEVHHKGEPVIEGRKYVLRTDVMYKDR